MKFFNDFYEYGNCLNITNRRGSIKKKTGFEEVKNILTKLQSYSPSLSHSEFSLFANASPK